MCVMSRSSPAVEAAAVPQPGSAQEQRQQQRQQQELDGNIAQQLAGEDISLGEQMRPFFPCMNVFVLVFDEKQCFRAMRWMVVGWAACICMPGASRAAAVASPASAY
jgi:hypothetical protein